MYSILFLDEVCNKPYDPNVLATEALGGTEATVIRVAEGLAQAGHAVSVAQHNRKGSSTNLPLTAAYLEPGTIVEPPTHVVSLRSPETLREAKGRFPKAKHYIWNHDVMVPSTARELVSQTGYTAIAVSNFHKTQMQQILIPQGYSGNFPIKVIYNPIADDLLPDNSPFDRNKLVFFSSPHKGLSHALSLFRNLRSFNSDFTLYVANPGYYETPVLKQDGVVVLGPLPHAEAIAHVRQSLCSFLPNTVCPETFGLVFAESSAVGTPALTHRFGAAPEVTYHPSELVDARDPKSVIDRVMAWHSGERPRVRGRKEFRLSNIIRAWERLLNG